MIPSMDISQGWLESLYLLSSNIDQLLVSLWPKKGTVMVYIYWFYFRELCSSWLTPSYRAFWSKVEEICSKKEKKFFLSVRKNAYPYN